MNIVSIFSRAPHALLISIVITMCSVHVASEQKVMDSFSIQWICATSHRRGPVFPDPVIQAFHEKQDKEKVQNRERYATDSLRLGEESPLFCTLRAPHWLRLLRHLYADLFDSYQIGQQYLDRVFDSHGVEVFEQVVSAIPVRRKITLVLYAPLCTYCYHASALQDHVGLGLFNDMTFAIYDSAARKLQHWDYRNFRHQEHFGGAHHSYVEASQLPKALPQTIIADHESTPSAQQQQFSHCAPVLNSTGECIGRFALHAYQGGVGAYILAHPHYNTLLNIVLPEPIGSSMPSGQAICIAHAYSHKNDLWIDYVSGPCGGRRIRRAHVQLPPTPC